MASSVLVFAVLSTLVLLTGADYVLYNGEALMAGQNLTNGPYQLAMQDNCELVLYRDGWPTWKANIDPGHGGPNCYLGLKSTGELVIRRDVHYTLWSSAARAKKGKYALMLDATGSLNIYGNKRWTSNNPKEAGKPNRSAVSTEYVLTSGYRLMLGQKLEYRDYELAFDRCNLVINNTISGKILWQTNTKSNGCYLQLESNGELMLKHVNQKLWSSSKKWAQGRYIAVMRFDGRLAVYGPLLWSSNNGTRSSGLQPGDQHRRGHHHQQQLFMSV